MTAATWDEDTALVQAALKGNQQSFQLLYRRHQARVRAVLYRLCGADGLDDLVQEVFLRAWKGLGKFRQTAQFATWLYRIACNVAYDRRRAIAQHRERYTTVSEEVLYGMGQGGEELQQMHYRHLVSQGLAQLSFAHRSVLVLHDLEELSQKEISAILGVPVGTVKSRLFHARSQMRQFLVSQGVEL